MTDIIRARPPQTSFVPNACASFTSTPDAYTVYHISTVLRSSQIHSLTDNASSYTRWRSPPLPRRPSASVTSPPVSDTSLSRSSASAACRLATFSLAKLTLHSVRLLWPCLSVCMSVCVSVSSPLYPRVPRLSVSHHITSHHITSHHIIHLFLQLHPRPVLARFSFVSACLPSMASRLLLIAQLPRGCCHVEANQASRAAFEAVQQVGGLPYVFGTNSLVTLATETAAHRSAGTRLALFAGDEVLLRPCQARVSGCLVEEVERKHFLIGLSVWKTIRSLQWAPIKWSTYGLRLRLSKRHLWVFGSRPAD
ncbi:unnamed protein product [Protopolystoma xenopodis]|uniref:Uncharacterized protein n=1 Tax=Protopolystoma xenopodis TaxID=117903 RepID=A0A3S5BS16_9PLAT|nr:unnamed protein product [Protopolystoma xenopodis]